MTAQPITRALVTPSTPATRGPAHTLVDLDEIDQSNWQVYSACAENNWPSYLPSTTPHDPEVFFPKRLEGGQCAPAKSLCFQCPVRQHCLTEGLREPSGVWGGLSEKERRAAQKMAKAGATIPEILSFFDNQQPKRRRRTTIIPTTNEQVVEAASLTSTVIEQFVEITGTLPTGAGAGQGQGQGRGAKNRRSEARLTIQVETRTATSVVPVLGPSPEVLREQQRRRNGLR